MADNRLEIQELEAEIRRLENELAAAERRKRHLEAENKSKSQSFEDNFLRGFMTRQQQTLGDDDIGEESE